MKRQRSLLVIALMFVAGCASSARPFEGAITEEGVDIYLSGDHGGVVRYALLSNDSGEFGIDSVTEVANRSSLNIVYRRSELVPKDIKLVSIALFENVISLAGSVELSQLVNDVKEYESVSGK